MPDYYVFRVILGLVQAELAYQIWRRRVGYLLWFAIAMGWAALLNLIPSFHGSHLFRQLVTIPEIVLWTAFLIVASLDMFSIMYPRTFPDERRRIAYFSGWVTFCVVLYGWYWNPITPYQYVTLVCQYATIFTTIMTWAAWTTIAWRRPLKMPETVIQHGWLWCLWLVMASCLAAGCEGGLLWLVRQRTAESMRSVLLWGLVVMAGLTVCFRLNLQRWPLCPASRASKPQDHQG